MTPRGNPQAHLPLRRRRSFRISCGISLGLALAALFLACGLTDDSQAVILQHISGTMAQSGVHLVSAYLAVQIALEHGAQQLAEISFASRNSSREEIGAGLGETYTSLSQVLAAANILYKDPGLVSEKRNEAMKFNVSRDSPIREPLQRFLNLSSPLDENLLTVVLDSHDLAALGLKQQKLTEKTIRSLDSISYWDVFERAGICLLGTSSQERILYRRLLEHVQALSYAVAELDGKVRSLLQAFIKLEHATREISKASVEEYQRLLSAKQEVAAQFDWLLRAAIQLLVLPEPWALARISKNIEMAQDIHGWSYGVVIWLEHMTTELRHAKLKIHRLMENLRNHNTVKWGFDELDDEMEALRAQWANGTSMLQTNTAARHQLQRFGYL